MYSARENILVKARQDLEVVKNQVKRMSYLQEQTEENLATGYSRHTKKKKKNPYSFHTV